MEASAVEYHTMNQIKLILISVVFDYVFKIRSEKHTYFYLFSHKMCSQVGMKQ